MAGAKIKNVIQTNATLLNEQWVSFFLRHDFRVGVSLDGPKALHDHYRVTINGKGSHDRIMRNLVAARQQGLNFSVIATINHNNVNSADEIFAFFLDNDIRSFGFNMVYEKDSSGQPYEFSVTNEEYGRFQSRIFDLWLERNDPRVKIRHIDSILTGMVGRTASSCIYAGTCSRFINVNSNGDVYPCERLTDAPRLGNLLEAPLVDILSNRPYECHSAMTMALPEDCQRCRYLNVCRNGCTHHRNNGKLYFCEGRLQVFRHIEKRLGGLVGNSKLALVTTT